MEGFTTKELAHAMQEIHEQWLEEMGISGSEMLEIEK